MKKLILIILTFILLTSLSFSQTWYPANQKTIAWDAVTELDDGSPIPSDDKVKYQIYIVQENSAKSTAIILGTTEETQFLVTIPHEGKWFVGVKAQRFDSNGNLISESEISWSDNSVYCQNNETFGISFFRVPKQPEGLRAE